MHIAPRAPILRLLALLAAAVLGAVLVAVWLTTRDSTDDEAQGEERPALNQGALELVSRPDLHPASMSVTMSSGFASPGLLFVTPGSRLYGDTGPMIVDRKGEPVWVGGVPQGQNATAFSMQSYKGRPVLTWWQGVIDRNVGAGTGFGVIVDASYRQVAKVQAVGLEPADLHEFLITPRDTALLVVYREVARDLSEYGGPADGRLLDNLVQEVDIETGRLLFEWSAFQHVPPGESYQEMPDGGAWDPYHLNSVAMDAGGDLLVSARHTWAVYKIDGGTGDVVWRLGGKKSDFSFGRGARFAWQHDARWRASDELTVFDNQAANEIAEADHSRGLILRLDEAAGRATLIREFTHPAGLLAGSQGSLQNLPGGGVLIGWGSKPHLSEYDAEGRLVFDAQFFATDQSYRALMAAWTGRPLDRPAVVAVARGSRTTVHVSWNGATEVASWRVLAARVEGGEQTQVTTARKGGFETAIAVDHQGPFFRVQALDDRGTLLAESVTVRATATATATSPSPVSPEATVR